MSLGPDLSITVVFDKLSASVILGHTDLKKPQKNHIKSTVLLSPRLCGFNTMLSFTNLTLILIGKVNSFKWFR